MKILIINIMLNRHTGSQHGKYNKNAPVPPQSKDFSGDLIEGVDYSDKVLEDKVFIRTHLTKKSADSSWAFLKSLTSSYNSSVTKTNLT